jgi:hypothetical protein
VVMGSRLETINSALAHWIIRGFITIEVIPIYGILCLP